MPLDYRRINGPEDVIPYRLFTNLSSKLSKKQYQQLFKENLRKDERNALEPRKIFLETGHVSHAKGSAYIEQGQTKVLVSVFDPREIPNRSDYCQKGEIYCEFKFAPFSCVKRKIHQQDSQEKECSTIMKNALEAAVCRHEFPNFQIDIYALVLHNDGSALSAAITAAGVALASAGVPIFDIITSATIAVQGNNYLLDPTKNEEELSEVSIEEENEHGILTICFMSTNEQISYFHQVGCLNFETIEKNMNHLIKSCKDTVPLVQKCLIKSAINKVSD